MISSSTVCIYERANVLHRQGNYVPLVHHYDAVLQSIKHSYVVVPVK